MYIMKEYKLTELQIVELKLAITNARLLLSECSNFTEKNIADDIVRMKRLEITEETYFELFDSFNRAINLLYDLK